MDLFIYSWEYGSTLFFWPQATHAHAHIYTWRERERERIEVPKKLIKK